MAKARVGFYSVQGSTIERTHKVCPKCGPGVFLAEHADRRSCGRCGYSETRPIAEKPTKIEKPKPVKAPKPA